MTTVSNSDDLPELPLNASFMYNRWIHFLLPMPLEILLYFLISTSFLLIVNANALLGYYSQKLLGDNRLLTNSFDSGFREFLAYIDKLLGARVPTYVFWAVIGIFAYLLVLLMYNMFINLRNDFVAQSFTRPQGNSRKSYWHPIIMNKLILFILLTGAAVYAFLFVKYIHILTNAFYMHMIYPPHLSGWLWCLFDVLVGALILYVAAIMAKLCHRSWQIIQDGL